MREPNTCKLRHLHHNKTHFQFNSFYGDRTTILRVFNSTLPKLGRYGLCHNTYPNPITNNVEEIDLSDVQLEEMTSDAFQDCYRLKILILRFNKIETLEEVFNNNRELEKLDLTNNLIKKVRDDTFVELTKLKELLLSNNYLIQFSPNLMENCVNLEVLRLDSNDLFDLDTQKIFEYAPRLKKLALNNNQLRCDRVKELQRNLVGKVVVVDYEYEAKVRHRIEPTESVESMICLDNKSWVTVHYIFAYTKIMEGN